MTMKYVASSGKVFDREEIDNAIKVAKDGWWTEGEFALEFEKIFSKYLGVSEVALVNSGSSANLLAVAALFTKEMGARRLRPGDEFITCAVGFPTTVNPGIIYGLRPVFVDSNLDTLNIDLDQVEKAITRKTKLIMVAHTLGKPIDMEKLVEICKRNKLWLIEDCCDALGSKFNKKMIGNFGDVATYSFYPAHQITMGEGGAVVTNNVLIHKAVRQLRDWGRDCWCHTGKDDNCKRRFKWKLGELPYGYDHKYIYSQIGFNLKVTDFQAAIGVAQMKKLKKFIELRNRNYEIYYRFFKKYDRYFRLLKKDEREEPSYFGFPVIVKNNKLFSRNEIVEFLEKNQIGTRNVFGGNLMRHPAYCKIKDQIRVLGELKNADIVMNQAFWIGVYPGIDKEMTGYVKTKVTAFIEQKEREK